MATEKKKKNNALDEIISTLKEVPIFKAIADKPEELKIIASVMVARKVKKNTEIIKEGEFGDILYVCVSNRGAKISVA